MNSLDQNDGLFLKGMAGKLCLLIHQFSVHGELLVLRHTQDVCDLKQGSRILSHALPISIVACNQERKFQSLLFIQSWVTVGGVATLEIFFSQTFTTANAFCDSIARELQMDTTKN